jgi:hypothetical protein
MSQKIVTLGEIMLRLKPPLAAVKATRARGVIVPCDYNFVSQKNRAVPERAAGWGCQKARSKLRSKALDTCSNKG